MYLITPWGSAQYKNIPQEAFEGVEDKPVQLTYRFAPGHNYLFSSSVESNLNFLGLEIKVDHSLYGKVAVLEAKGEMYKISSVLQRVKMKSAIPDSSTIEIDTDKVSDKDMKEAALIKKMTKQEFAYSINKWGKASEFKDKVDTLYQEIKDRVPPKFQETLKEELPRHMQVFLQIFPPFPKKPKDKVERGYYWVVPMEYPFGALGVLQSKNVYYYIGVANYENTPCAKIVVQTKGLVFDTNPASIAKALPMLRKLGFSEVKDVGEELPLQIKFDHGTLHGEIFVDLKTGETVFHKVTGQLTLMVTLFGGDPTESTVDFNMTIQRDAPNAPKKEDTENE
jgi:hypothetical protein